MIGRLVLFTLLVLIVAGLGIGGTVHALTSGFHSVSTNPVIHKIGVDIYNKAQTEISTQLQNATNAIPNYLGGLNP